MKKLLISLVTIGVRMTVMGNWHDAVNYNTGLIKIPLQNPRGHAWFAALQMGTPMQFPQICVFDNNHALSVVFGENCSNCPHKSYNEEKSSTFKAEA